MKKKWLVTQYDAHTDRVTQSKVYKFHLWAIIVAWVVSGKGFGGKEYYTQVRETR